MRNFAVKNTRPTADVLDNHFQGKSLFSFMSKTISFISFGACILLIGLGWNRGFDISDEGLYALLANPHQENQSGIINYDLFFKLLFQWTGFSFSMVELRFLRLLSYLLGGIALSFFLKNNTKHPFDSLHAFILASLGLFSGYAFLPPSFSYNSSTVVLASCWLAIAFSPLSSGKKSIFLGFILALIFYFKFPVASLLFLATLFLLIFSHQFTVRSLVYLILPFLVMEMSFKLIFDDFAIKRLLEAVPQHTTRPGYGFLSVMKSPILGLTFALIAMVPGLLYLKVKEGSQGKKLLLWMFGLGIISWLIFFTHVTVGEWEHVVMVLTAAMIPFSWRKLPKFDSFAIPQLTLFLMPFILHFGSNVYWMRIGVHYLIFWALLILVQQSRNTRYYLNTFPVLVVCLVFNGIWWHPFGQDSPLWKPKVPLTISEGNTLFLDSEVIRVITEIRPFVQDKKLHQIFTAYRIPGLAYLAGITIPHSPVVWDKKQLDQSQDSAPPVMIFQPLESLPENWNFNHSQNLGTIQGNPILLLWN